MNEQHADRQDVSDESGLHHPVQELMIDSFLRTVKGFDAVVAAVGNLAGPAAAAQTAADSVLFAARFAAAGAGFSFEQDGDYPLLEKFLSFTGKGHGIGNPDCSYHHAALNGRHRYRITGNRGTGWLMDAEVATFTIADRRQTTSDSFSSRKIEIPKGEDFEIILSHEEQDGYWLKLPESGPCFIIFREYFYDWDTEIPARIMIERIGASYPPPTTTPRLLQDRAAAFSAWMNSEYLVPNRLRILAKEPNTLEVMGFAQAYLQANHYVNGTLLCDAESALIIEMPEPVSKYWNIAIFDALGGVLHPHMRQNSINGHQANIDRDGMFRAVVAQSDPGVANWLDSAGRDLVLVMARVNGASEAPKASITKVSLASLYEHLPEETALTTAAERQDILRRRLKAAYRLLMIDY